MNSQIRRVVVTVTVLNSFLRKSYLGCADVTSALKASLSYHYAEEKSSIYFAYITLLN